MLRCNTAGNRRQEGCFQFKTGHTRSTLKAAKQPNVKNIKPVFPALLLAVFLLVTGCDEMHEMACASLDLNHLDYTGPSPYPPPLGDPGFNLEYLWLEYIGDLLFGENRAAYDEPYLPLDNATDANGKPLIPHLPPVTGAQAQNHNFSLSEGLEYVVKGGKQSDGGVTTVTKLNYLEIPVLFNYNHTLGNGKSVFHAGLGPWVAIALSGKFKTAGQQTAIKFGSNGDFNRMDFGAGFKVGFLFVRKWDVSLGYDLGMSNLLGGGADGDKGKTRNLSLSLGYRIR